PGEDDVAPRPAALALHLAQQGQHHRVHVLHVHGAAAPDVAVAYLARERVHRPVGGVGRDDVEVAVDEQGGQRRVGALDAGDHVAAARQALDVGGLDPDLGQPGHDDLGGGTLAGAAAVSVVGAVGADELHAQVGDFLFCGGRHGVVSQRVSSVSSP